MGATPLLNDSLSLLDCGKFASAGSPSYGLLIFLAHVPWRQSVLCVFGSELSSGVNGPFGHRNCASTMLAVHCRYICSANSTYVPTPPI